MKISDIQKLKNSNTPFTTITAYDYPTAKIINELDIPLILVGDSASMVVYGYSDTTPITMDEMILIAKAVRRGVDNALVVGDMPFMSYQPSSELAIENAGRFIKEASMDAVKLEGGVEHIEQIQAVIRAGIPVMGHVGLKPQSVLVDSGYKIHGKTLNSALKIFHDALALENAGVFSLVLEGVPEELAQLITNAIKIPTIGIGAGKFCDGQIQVIHDLIGLYGKGVPKHAKAYLDLKMLISKSLGDYKKDVTNTKFPSKENTYNLDKSVLEKLKEAIANI